MIFIRLFVAALLFGGCLIPNISSAQVPPNCEPTSVTDPDRTVLVCAFGIVIEVEAAAELGITAPTSEVDPSVFELNSGAALIEVEPGQLRPQIKTPHAIAAVRGTIYVVDVTETTTSVFVVQGEVLVSKLDSAHSQVSLKAGEGVDVSSDQPLRVAEWGEKRASALLARFGR